MPGASKLNLMANLKNHLAQAAKSHAISSSSVDRSLAPSIWPQHGFFVTRLGILKLKHPQVRWPTVLAPKLKISRDGASQQGLRRNGATFLRVPRFSALYMPLTSWNTASRYEGASGMSLDSCLVRLNESRWSGSECKARNEVVNE